MRERADIDFRMSAFGGKADVAYQGLSGPFLARSKSGRAGQFLAPPPRFVACLSLARRATSTRVPSGSEMRSKLVFYSTLIIMGLPISPTWKTKSSRSSVPLRFLPIIAASMSSGQLPGLPDQRLDHRMGVFLATLASIT